MAEVIAKSKEHKVTLVLSVGYGIPSDPCHVVCTTSTTR